MIGLRLDRQTRSLVPAGRLLVMLEGGYDLDALTMCTAAALGALAGRDVQPEAQTSGGPGARNVQTCLEIWKQVDEKLGERG